MHERYLTIISHSDISDSANQQAKRLSWEI